MVTPISAQPAWWWWWWRWWWWLQILFVYWWLHPSALNHCDDNYDDDDHDSVHRNEDDENDDHEPIMILCSSLFQFVDTYHCLLILLRTFIWIFIGDTSTWNTILETRNQPKTIKLISFLTTRRLKSLFWNEITHLCKHRLNILRISSGWEKRRRIIQC